MRHTRKSVEALPALDSEWCSWFAGFCDGEASFNCSARGGSSFKLCLREDDAPVLFEIQTRLGVGSVNGPYASTGSGRRRPCYVFTAHGLSCKRIVEALEGRMRSKKLADFELWSDAVCEAAARGRGNQALLEKTNIDIQAIRRFKPYAPALASPSP